MWTRVHGHTVPWVGRCDCGEWLCAGTPSSRAEPEVVGRWVSQPRRSIFLARMQALCPQASGEKWSQAELCCRGRLATVPGAPCAPHQSDLLSGTQCGHSVSRASHRPCALPRPSTWHSCVFREHVLLNCFVFILFF